MIILVINKHLFDIYIYIYIYIFIYLFIYILGKKKKKREQEGDYPLRIKEPIFKGTRQVNV